LPKQYQIIPTKTFLKDLEKRVDLQYTRQIEKVIDKLAKNPYQGIKLSSIKIGQWRIRIGDYRIRYDIEGNKVILLRVRHRKDIYRK